MRWLVPAGGVALAFGLSLALACTHTVEGTGAPSPDTGTSGSPSASATATTGSADCVSVAGVWDVKASAPPACNGDSCTISQNGCALSLRCINGTYAGAATSDGLSWVGVLGACNATLGPKHLTADGTCTTASGACNLSAVKR